jgi:glyoxylase-like metal-dependent hydrolase (beta-lactamase superfamily II)
LSQASLKPASLEPASLEPAGIEPASVGIGDFRVQLLRAGVYWWDGGAFFGVVPKTLWNPLLPADAENRIPAALNCYLIEAGGQRILIETGGGERHDARSRERMRFPEGAGRIPVEAGSIDIVVNSHLHWDHCGGNTADVDGNVVPAFPNARYFTQRGEHAHAWERLARDSMSYRDINYEPLIAGGQMTLLDGDAEVAPGIQLQVAPGHTRDMCIVLARSRGETFCFWSDLIPTAVNLHPTWVTAFDLYPLTTIENKARLLETAVREGWWCGFAHDSNIAFARIGKDSKGRFSIHEQIA